MIVAKILKYIDIKRQKDFRIEPSRRGTKKRTDPEQLRIFMERQKNLPALWRKMGIVSLRVLELNPGERTSAEAGVNPDKCRIIRTYSF
jgi:hypothetical protein